MKCMTLLAKCVAAGLVGLPMSAAIAATPLFSDAPLVLRSPSFDAAYTALVDQPSSHAIQIVQADSRLVDESAESIALNFDFDGRIDLTAVRTNAYRTEDGSLVWQGVIAESSGKRDTTDRREISDDPMNSVTLVRNGDRITGNVRVFGQLYAIRPLHDNRTALVEVNEDAMPPDHPEASYKRLFDAAVTKGMEDKSLAPDAVTANTVIRVMVNYTQKVASLVGDINGLITLAVAESNQGYTNSGVSITMQLANKSQVTYTETGNFDTDLARYRGTSDGYMDSIHTLRNSSTADVGVLLVNNTAYCGLASAIGASASTAFVEVYWDCATGYYSFAHEIGHLQSARHDPANDPANTPYAYGHGYQYSTGGWRTIMAYNCTSSCTRLNFWSNPGKTYNGHAMGTTSKNDNHRVLNNTRATIAAFR